MLFSEALRDSKLFSLPPRSVAKKIKSINVPKHQAIVAPSASAYRRDWGLKFPVTDAKQKVIEFQSFEDEFSTNGVNIRPRFTRKVANLDYISVPVNLPGSLSWKRRLASLNASPNELSERPSRKREIEHLSTKKFRQVLRNARESEIQPPEPVTVSSFSASAETVPAQWQVSAIGASYAMKGVLHNFPDGVAANLQVLGRRLPAPKSKNAVAFGGFIALHNGGTNTSPLLQAQNFGVTGAESNNDGELNLSVMNGPANTEYSSNVLDNSINVGE